MRNIFTLILIITIAFTSSAQSWKIAKPKSANGCYTTQIIETVETYKKSALDSEKYHYDIKITFENALDVKISFSYRYKDSFGESTGRITLNPREIDEVFVTRQISKNSLLNIQPIEASKLKYENLEILGEKIHQSKYINCLERYHLYRAKKQKEIRDKKESKSSSSNNKINSNKESRPNNSQVTSINNNSSSNINNYSESVYDKRQREAREKENRVKVAEKKRYDDGMNFLKSMNKREEKMIHHMDKLENDLKTNIQNQFDYWANERQFQSKISSLSSIRSKDSQDIIREANRKADAIDSEFESKRSAHINRITSAMNTSTGNALEDAGSKLGGTIALIATQRIMNKEKAEALKELEENKKKAFQELANKLKENNKQLLKNSIKAASYAIDNETEKHYLERYRYATCINEKAYYIVKGSSSCGDLPKDKNFRWKRYSGKDYFSAYERKKKSNYNELNKKSSSFLELAIEKEPNNIKWLSIKESQPQTPFVEKLAISKKIIELNPNHEQAQKQYAKHLSTVRRFVKNKSYNQLLPLVKNGMYLSLIPKGINLLEFASENNKDEFVSTIHENDLNLLPKKIKVLHVHKSITDAVQSGSKNVINYWMKLGISPDFGLNNTEVFEIAEHYNKIEIFSMLFSKSNNQRTIESNYRGNSILVMALAHLDPNDAAKELDLLPNKQRINTLRKMLSDSYQKPFYMESIVLSKKSSESIRNNKELSAKTENYFERNIASKNIKTLTDLLESPYQPLTSTFINSNSSLLTELGIKEDNINFVELLATKKLISETCKDGSPTSFLLIKHGDTVLEKGLLNNLAFNVKDSKGSGLIHYLCYEKRYRIINYFFANTSLIDFNQKGMYGWTPLHYAVRENNKNLTKALLTSGVKKNPRDNWGRTPYKIAKERRFKPLMNLLK